MFKYLGRILPSENSDCPAVSGNIFKVRQKWGKLSCMLIREGSYHWTSRRLYLSVLQYVLMFGSEMCVLMFHILRAMVSLHNRATCQISGRMHQRLWSRGCYYPLIREVLVDAGLEKIGV